MHRFFFTILFYSSLSLFAQQDLGWLQRMNLPATGRHRSVAVSIGDRVYVGMGHINAVVDILFNDWWEFDPGSNSWTQKANYGGGLMHHGFGFVIGNTAYVGMGRTPAGNTNAVWSFSPLTNTWIAKNPFPGLARRGSVGFSIGNKGYVGTGNTNSGYTNDFWEYDPSFDSWIQRASFPPGNRFAAVGFSIGTKGYIGTGEQSSMPSGSKNDLWEYDPTGNFWVQKANVPGINRLAACGFSCNGKGYVGTGEDFQSGNNFGDFHCFDPATNSWTTMNEFSGIARRYMVGASVGPHAFVGLGTNGTNFSDWWELGYLSGEEEISKDNISVKVFPNPMKDVATLEIQNSKIKIQDYLFEIFDVKGYRVRAFVTRHSSFVIARDNLSTGIYFYKVKSENEILASGKLIIAP